MKEIHRWKTPHRSLLTKVFDTLNRPSDMAGEAVMRIPGVGYLIERSIGGVISLLNDVASYSVRPQAILKEFQSKGLAIDDLGQIATLSLKDIDKAIGYLGAKYKALAAAEGAATGFSGLAGISLDVVAVIALNLRAIGEYATYYGFDVNRQEERLFMLNILALASSPSDASKELALAQLVRIARDVARKRAWKDLEHHTLVAIVRRIAQALGIRLTKAKLAQLLPILGAGISGGYNIYYTSKVCTAANYLYRERFLAQRYGPELIEETVPEAPTLEPRYETD